MQIRTKSFVSIFESKKSLLLTILLSALLFWIGLGVGDNMSDSTFWIQSTWNTIKLEWLFILLYMMINRKLPSLYVLWTNYRFVTLISILWLTTVTLSYLLSPYYSWQNPLAFMRFSETISHFLFFLFLWDFFVRYNVDYRIIFSAIIISTLMVMSYFIYIHFAFPDLNADQHVFSMRSEQLILNTHLHRIGYQVEAVIAFSIAFLFAKNYKYIFILIVGLLFMFMLWLGGRASILGIVVALLIFFLYFRKNISLKTLMSTGILLVILVSISSYFQWMDLDYFTHAIKKTLQADSLEYLMTGRIEVWSLTLKELQDHWLLGTGPQSYFFYPDRHKDVIHAHNFIFQMLGEWGVIGTGLFSMLLYRAIRYGMMLHMWRPFYPERYHLSAGLVILALTITSLFGGIYFFCQTSVYLAIAFALWITPSASERSNYK